MRKIKIATASSCTARVWKNTEVSYEELCKKLTTTTYTDETVAEYKQMKKADRDAVKDKGGFVPAVLKDNRRLIKNVISISCNKLDKDSASVEFLDHLREDHPYDWVVYTTHSSTPEAPRYRTMTFYTRDVTPEEDNAIGRYLAEEVYGGINDIDPVSFRANQLIYYPTPPKDGEFVGLHLEGPTLDPDVFLAAHPDWKDITNLPRGEKEKRKQLSGVMRAAGPLTKDGIIGTSNRCYSISEAIDVFLSDVYAPTDDRCRYHYIPSDSMAGALVYDDKKFYSFHSSDPAFGRCLNAFDLVRIHKFGNKDNEAPDNTPVSRLPSNYYMRELASKQFQNTRKGANRNDIPKLYVERCCGSSSIRADRLAGTIFLHRGWSRWLVPACVGLRDTGRDSPYADCDSGQMEYFWDSRNGGFLHYCRRAVRSCDCNLFGNSGDFLSGGVSD